MPAWKYIDQDFIDDLKESLKLRKKCERTRISKVFKILYKEMHTVYNLYNKTKKKKHGLTEYYSFLFNMRSTLSDPITKFTEVHLNMGFDSSDIITLEDGRYAISNLMYNRWKKLIDNPYSDLKTEEEHYDRVVSNVGKLRSTYKHIDWEFDLDPTIDEYIKLPRGLGVTFHG